MKRKLQRLAVVLVLSAASLATLSAAPAQAAPEHSSEVCRNNYSDDGLARLGVCLSVHHSLGTATPHARLHSYRKCGSAGATT